MWLELGVDYIIYVLWVSRILDFQNPQKYACFSPMVYYSTIKSSLIPFNYVLSCVCKPLIKSSVIDEVFSFICEEVGMQTVYMEHTR